MDNIIYKHKTKIVFKVYNSRDNRYEIGTSYKKLNKVYLEDGKSRTIKIKNCKHIDDFIKIRDNLLESFN